MLRQPPPRRPSQSVITKQASKPSGQPPLGRLPVRAYATQHARGVKKSFRPVSSAQGPPRTFHEPSVEIAYAKESTHKLLNLSNVPYERQTLQALAACHEAADALVKPAQSSVKEPRPTEKTAGSALLNLDASRPLPAAAAGQAVDELSSLAYSIVTHPPVFLTQKILASYVNLQALLGRPETFPLVFDMFAEKPVPPPAGTPLNVDTPFKGSKPSAASAAIFTKTVDRALSAAIAAKQMSTCLGIVSTSLRTPAFRRAKFVRQVLPLAAGGALAPAAVYTLATQFAENQVGLGLDSTTATMVAFGGIATYLFTVTSIGLVAITTANDQMKRVTWVEGTKLSERYFREAERAALDKIALAWGFQDRYKWGEEEGIDWERLKEWAGVRGMIIDRTSLLDGMS